MKAIVIKAIREGYAPCQIRSTMTAAELINILEQYDADSPVYLSHNNGYTYGGITSGRVSSREIE